MANIPIKQEDTEGEILLEDGSGVIIFEAGQGGDRIKPSLTITKTIPSLSGVASIKPSLKLIL